MGIPNLVQPPTVQNKDYRLLRPAITFLHFLTPQHSTSFLFYFLHTEGFENNETMYLCFLSV